MSFNSFGNLFKFTSYGESHGPAIGCVVDGVPPNILLLEKDIQYFLDRRKPGQSKYVTQRKENDKVEILSGVFENKTTGHPIALNIRNEDHRSKDYSEIANKFRPSHADITYHEKYKIRDYRGGGRSSARETAVRVAAGAIAFQILKKKFPKLKIKASVVQIGNIKINKSNFNGNEVNKNPFFCGDLKTVPKWENFLDKLRKNGDSAGAIIEVICSNIPKGIGSPIYKKLDSQIAEGIMSINAVKGVEIGSGFTSASLTGSQNNDEIYPNNKDSYKFKSNNAGGILGGISTGQPVVVRLVVKPTSSILIEKDTIDKFGRKTKIITKGRHDPCVGIRAVPIVEAMMAIILVDQIMMHEAQIGPIEK